MVRSPHRNSGKVRTPHLIPYRNPREIRVHDACELLVPYPYPAPSQYSCQDLSEISHSYPSISYSELDEGIGEDLFTDSKTTLKEGYSEE